MRLVMLFMFLTLSAAAQDFDGPDVWAMVNTNAVRKWQKSQPVKADSLLLEGVIADKTKREVRLLVESTGQSEGTTVEFLVVAPGSDRAYEAVAVSVAMPDDIVKAVEFLGIKRGSCVDSMQFKYWPLGESFEVFVRRLDIEGAEECPLSSHLLDSEPDEALLRNGVIFTAGEWSGKRAAASDKSGYQPPCSVISLFNDITVFDLPQRIRKDEAYGRITLAEEVPRGALMEVILRPTSAVSKLMPLVITARITDGEMMLDLKDAEGSIDRSEDIKSAMAWMQKQRELGKDLYLTLAFDENLSVKEARAIASVFRMLDGMGLKLHGRVEGGVYYRAFLPHESWRERKGRNPQPFEVHVKRDDAGKLQKKLIFIEEDWSVEGFDPKLTPKEYLFKKWSELLPLIATAGGKNNRSSILFLFVPLDMKLSEFMPVIRNLKNRLPLVHIFGE